TRCLNRSVDCTYDLELRVKMPLNPAFLSTTTASSGSLDVSSVQSHHEPNMGGNNNFSFLDAQPDQFAAVSTPEMEFPSMPSTTPADAHAISDGSPTALQTHMWTTGHGFQHRQNQDYHVTLTSSEMQREDTSQSKRCRL
ncbi:hypothetical protein E4U09_005731, partial [Claviceps aff. purpurea]